MSTVFQHLLLATEHTEFDAGAESLAMAMAQRCDLPLSGVLPMLSNPEFEALAPELAARDDLQAAAKIAALHDMAQARGVHLDMQVRRGAEPYREIVEEARERGSDLLVIRRRGRRSFLANLLLGEMVSKVVAHAPCSVLIVPRDGAMWSRRVLVAVEPGAQGRCIARLAAAVAADCRLPLSVATVADPDPGHRAAAEAFVREVVAQARQGGVQADGEVLAGKPSEAILQAARRCGADLLVVGSRGDNHIARALVGGVAQKVIGLAEHPILVAHPGCLQEGRT